MEDLISVSKKYYTKQYKLVPGDVIIVENDKLIPADIRIIESN
jgi:magnesium-transporting ATPase (P-type)